MMVKIESFYLVLCNTPDPTLRGNMCSQAIRSIQSMQRATAAVIEVC